MATDYQVKQLEQQIERLKEALVKYVPLKYLEQFIKDIYFFEVNTKYNTPNALKISVISWVHSTSEIADISNT